MFITTKLTDGEHGYDTTLAAFDGSMEKLGIDVLDLFLIHWPLPMFDDADMAEISKVRTGQRLGADPNVFAMR